MKRKIKMENMKMNVEMENGKMDMKMEKIYRVLNEGWGIDKVEVDELFEGYEVKENSIVFFDYDRGMGDINIEEYSDEKWNNLVEELKEMDVDSDVSDWLEGGVLSGDCWVYIRV